MTSSTQTEIPAAEPSAPAAGGEGGAALDRKFSRSVRDNVVAECLVQGVRVCAMVVLARALGAAEFGVFRVLLVAAVFAITGLQPGLIEALVQRKNLNALMKPPPGPSALPWVWPGLHCFMPVLR